MTSHVHDMNNIMILLYSNHNKINIKQAVISCDYGVWIASYVLIIITVSSHGFQT